MTNFAGTTNGLDPRGTGLHRQQPVGHLPRARLLGDSGRSVRAEHEDAVHRRAPAAVRVDLGHNMSVSATYYHRRTRDIFEDFDPGVYTVPSGVSVTARQHQRAELAVPRLGLLRFRSEQPAGGELLPRHPQGRRAQLQRSRVRLPEALREPLAERCRPTTTWTRRATPCRTATPTSRATCSGSIRARPTCPARFPARFTTSSRRRLLHHERGASNSVAATAGTRARSSTRRSSRRAVVCRSRSRRRSRTAASPTSGWLPGAVGAVQNPSWGQFDLRAQYVKTFEPGHHRVLRRPVQRVQRPGRDPHGRPGGWHRHDQVRRRHPVAAPAARVPRRSRPLLE